MRSALLGGLTGAVVAAATLVGLDVVGDDDVPTAASSRTETVAQQATPSKAAAAQAADNAVGRVYEEAGPATVAVLTDRGAGTGFLVDDRGTIVTNAHVTDGSRTVDVRFGPEGERLRGTVRGEDVGSDLAVVRLRPDDVPDDVQPLELADSDSVKVGDPVVAIGNPFGLPRTATAGIVSAVGRTIVAPNQFSIPGAIQTDAAINPGNSGGPLLDAEARVIGVNSQIETSGGVPGNVGIGFAVPSNTVKDVVPDLQDDGVLRRAYLGVSTGEPEQGTGALVARTVPGSPAAKAGIRQGDVITAIDDAPVRSSEDVTEQIAPHRAGDRVTITVRRGGREREIAVTLGEQPERAVRAG